MRVSDSELDEMLRLAEFLKGDPLVKRRYSIMKELQTLRAVLPEIRSAIGSAPHEMLFGHLHKHDPDCGKCKALSLLDSALEGK